MLNFKLTNLPKKQYFINWAIASAVILTLATLFHLRFPTWPFPQLSHPVRASKITSEMRSALNDAYDIQIPHTAQVMGINYFGGWQTEYHYLSHFVLTETDWQGLQDRMGAPKYKFPVSQPGRVWIDDEGIGHVMYNSSVLNYPCSSFDYIGWDIDKSSIEAVYYVKIENRPPPKWTDYDVFTTVIQCFPIDGTVSVYFSREDGGVGFPRSVYAVDWGFRIVPGD